MNPWREKGRTRSKSFSCLLVTLDCINSIWVLQGTGLVKQTAAEKEESIWFVKSNDLTHRQNHPALANGKCFGTFASANEILDGVSQMCI
jgi:hypothetical protein